MYAPTANANYNVSTTTNSGPMIFGTGTFERATLGISPGTGGPSDFITHAFLVE
jgi:hypothetical protein